MVKETGGSAFPVTDEQSASGISAAPGMTLRDWFAGKALQGYISTYPEAHGIDFQEAAKHSYQIADAMIAARSETSEDAPSYSPEDYELSVRNRNVLKYLCIDTLDQLSKFTARDLHRIPNYGGKSFAELTAIMASIGISFAKEKTQ